MQNRYACDIGDYGKMGLLRHIHNQTGWSLGVVWYLAPKDNKNDGKHVAYLDKKKFTICDPELSETLKSLVNENRRSVESLERSGILPIETKYFSTELNFHLSIKGGTTKHTQQRFGLREQWYKAAVDSMKTQDVVFLDPDNGLEIKSCDNLGKTKAGKFAFYEEVKAFAEATPVVIIYHHLGRTGLTGKGASHEDQVRERAVHLKEKTGYDGKIFGIRFRPYSPRAYFILAREDRAEKLEAVLNGFFEMPWKNYWDRIV